MDFATWARSVDDHSANLLLLNRQAAENLCLETVERRRPWQSGLEFDAEAAAHTDNLIPVGRASRSWIGIRIELLRTYAQVLCSEPQGVRSDGLLTDAGAQRVAAADLDAVAKIWRHGPRTTGAPSSTSARNASILPDRFLPSSALGRTRTDLGRQGAEHFAELNSASGRHRQDMDVLNARRCSFLGTPG
ncbi:hypothetical protein [Streptosporangium lutulentum]|uniref:Uncharacterized protein n=1 Tax=Streptosporangium lutulentum TaxID=1461250 RepID=A0ABT9QMZ0_9ACTN|nr:hypothetical protein [Streptosporangium lutulentum]MDP9848101.1 hypothetical protein [Streptosporangium lutulentum]